MPQVQVDVKRESAQEPAAENGQLGLVVLRLGAAEGEHFEAGSAALVAADILAMGARAVMTGRPYLYGLSAFGASGVARVLELLRSETERTLGLLGCSRIDDLGRVRFARVRVGDARLAARVPNGFAVNGGTAGLRFDPAHVHVYADSVLVEGTA